MAAFSRRLSGGSTSHLPEHVLRLTRWRFAVRLVLFCRERRANAPALGRHMG